MCIFNDGVLRHLYKKVHGDMINEGLSCYINEETSQV